MEQGHGSDNDLPLMSNTRDVLVRHFVLDLACSFHDKVFSGAITLFLDLSPDGSSMQVFSIQEFQKHVIYKLNAMKEVNDEVSVDSKPCCSEGGISTGSEVESSKALIQEELKSSHDTRSDDEEGRKPFQLILECCDIDIIKVEALEFTKTTYDWLKLFSLDLDVSAKEFLDMSKQSFTKQLFHETDRWCLRIWDPDVFRPADFFHCIKIHYRTRPTGSSLRWAVDQDGNPCVYTSGMWINNRSLMPCQEYGSLSTWQASINVTSSSQAVLMSGDEEAVITMDGEMVTYYYKSRMPLPSFSLAIAVGSWECEVISPKEGDSNNQKSIQTPSGISQCNDAEQRDDREYLQKTCHHQSLCYIPYCSSPVLPCRIFAARSWLPGAVAEFRTAFPKYSTAVQRLLGPSPFQRLDILVYPSCSQDMAMSNPNLIFISQSMIPGDGSMLVSLGHELSHYWFGLLLGAKDWSEEWLSEGFATFVEYLIEADVRGWSEKEHQEQEEIVDYLRYQTLVTELSHTKQELQTLCPNHGENPDSSMNYIKNGMNPNKLFTQVHYLKGYFLLRWLTQEIGHQTMRSILREYIVQSHGRMVTSQEFLNLAFDMAPHLRNDHSVVDVFRDWLDCPGLPNKLAECIPSEENSFYQPVLTDLYHWERLDNSLRYRRQSGKRRKLAFQGSSLNAKQLMLLLNKLLQRRTLCRSTMTALERHYQLNKANAEVRHRWFEMVIKYRYTPAYANLGRYLVEHQAMGVYLYGEMVIARCRQLQSIAEKAFSEVSSDMEPTTRNVVQKMLFG